MSTTKEDWKEIKDYLLSKECADVHKLVWAEEAYIAEWNGQRYKIDNSWSMDGVRELVNSILITNKQRQSL